MIVLVYQNYIRLQDRTKKRRTSNIEQQYLEDMLNYSISKRSIYPSMELDFTESQVDGRTQYSHCSESQNYIKWWRQSKSKKNITRKQTVREDNEKRAQMQGIESMVEEIIEKNYEEKVNAVIKKGNQTVEKIKQLLEKVQIQGTPSAEESQLKEYLSKVKELLATAYIKRFKRTHSQQELISAKRLLKDETSFFETPYHRAKRLNNLGVCQLLLKRYANAYEYFSKAFVLYREHSNLNLIGLVRNIGQMYVRWEMYEAAAKFFEFILTENDRESLLTLNEEVVLVITILRCINSGGNFIARKAIFHRGDKLLKKINEKRGQNNLIISLKIQLVRYGVRWGVEQGDVNRRELDVMVKEIQSSDCQDLKITFLKAECLLVYRQLFQGVDWERYLKISQCAEKLFDELLSTQ